MKNIKNKQKGGILQIVIFVIVLILLLSYFHVTIAQAWHYLVTAFHNVFG